MPNLNAGNMNKTLTKTRPDSREPDTWASTVLASLIQNYDICIFYVHIQHLMPENVNCIHNFVLNAFQLQLTC
jgi:hypothetical protein